MEKKGLSSPCLLCSSPGGVPLPGDSPSPKGYQRKKEEDESSSPNNCPLLNSGLWSVFVLRKLLHFPRWEVECLLRELGGVHHPGHWYYLCESCTQLAKQTMELHHRIFELERKIAAKRAEAIDKLRSSFFVEKKVDHQQESSNNKIGAVCARATVREYFRVHLLRGRQPEPLRVVNDIKKNADGSGSERDDFDEHHQSSCPLSPAAASTSSVKPDVDSNDDDDDMNDKEKRTWDEHPAAFHSGGRKENVFCDICGTAASTKAALRRHKSRHHNPRKGLQKATELAEEQQHACKHCEFVASGPRALNRHQHKSHPQLLEFQCSECSQKFMKMNRMVHHYRIRHPGKSLELGFALESSNNSSDDIDDAGGSGGAGKRRRKHDQGMHSGEEEAALALPPGQGSTYCSHCRMWFPPESYPDHVKEKHAARRCKYCEYMPKPKCGRWDLARHERRHEEDPSFVFFKCDKCDYSCSTFSRRYVHIQKHKIHDNIETGPSSGSMSSSSCKLCSATFDNYAKATVHLRESHGAQLGLKQYKCSECSTSCTSSGTLRAHVLTAHKSHKKRWKCFECEFSSHTKASWDSHQAAFHSGGRKDLICDLCGKAVATKSGLRSHKMRAHRPEGVPPRVEGHGCKLCDFVGTNNIQLANHKLKEHPQLFQFQCSKCPRRFIQMHTMVHHYRIKHPGVRVNAS